MEVTIDLDVMGKITKSKNMIKFDYCLPISQTKSKAKLVGKTDLRTLVDREGMKTQGNFNKLAMLTQREALLPKIEKPLSSQRTLERPRSFRKRSVSKEPPIAK